MTEREPFAVIKEHGEGLYYLDSRGQAISEYFDTSVSSILACDEINAAFNKRLDEELAKARKEWERGK